MRTNPGLPEQNARIAELRRLGVLDASAKGGLDALARAAAGALGAPIAIVSLADLQGRWLNAPMPDDFACKPGECALGAYVSRERRTLAIADTRLDPRFRDHPWVTDAPFMVSYLGAPTIIASGFAVGALNVVDTRVREWTPWEIAIAEDLARIAASLLEARTVSSAMDVALDGIGVTDPNGVFTYMNQAHAQQFGYDTPAELIGRSWHVLVEPDQQDRIQSEAFPEVARTGAWAGEMIGRRRDGSAFPQEITLTALPTGGIICATRDISQRKALEAETLRQTEMRSRAEAASAAKSIFLAQVSHEIRTPLNAIMGLAGVLARTELDARQREMVSLLEVSSQSLDRLLGDILDLSRIEAGRFRLELAPFNLRDVVEAVARMAKLRAEEKGLAFHLDIAQTADRQFVGDAFRLRQLLLNLASNAVKFTERGEVRISVSARDDGAGKSNAEFVIRDTGIGFPAEDAARLFEQFEQADALIGRAYGGTGLGLAICRALTDAMGGAIEVRSAPGLGSAFKVRLPLALGQARTAIDNNDAHSANVAPAMRVLVAEDNPTNRLVIQLIFEGLGMHLRFVGTGAEAVQACREESFDVILMDVLMPEMDGVEAVRAIRAHEADTGAARTPIAMLSADVGSEQRARADAAGADLYIGKPLSARSLMQGVADVIAIAGDKVSGARATRTAVA